MSYRHNEFIKNKAGYKDPTFLEMLNKIDKTNDLTPALFDYISKKISMLENDFLVFPTDEEKDKLFSLRSVRTIDRQTIEIILTHWDAEERGGKN